MILDWGLSKDQAQGQVLCAQCPFLLSGGWQQDSLFISEEEPRLQEGTRCAKVL